jgi:tRNA pseudouridine32 synthase/23S rRNA pseudouridine746 synthase
LENEQAKQMNQDKMANHTLFELHIIITAEDHHQGLTVIDALVRECNIKNITLSKADIKSAISKGALWLTKAKHTSRVRRLKKVLTEQDSLHFYYNEAVLNIEPPVAKLIADLTDYSVWYKPYGMLSQGSKWSEHCTIARFAQLNLTPERPVFIVHRLDRAATGLILVAHSKKAAMLLSLMFEQHALEKHYQIIVQGDHSLRSQPDIITTQVDGKSACSTFNFQAFSQKKNRSLIDVKIESGRKHQIRIHANSIGYPVVGDRLHGNIDSKETNINLQLCAKSLAFICPITNEQRAFELTDDLSLSL